MKTIKVRVAVVVNQDGDWKAHSLSGQTDYFNRKLLGDLMAVGFELVWIEAEVPLPEPTVIQGEVK